MKHSDCGVPLTIIQLWKGDSMADVHRGAAEKAIKMVIRRERNDFPRGIIDTYNCLQLLK